jgi:Flp pilus assembly protein TadB
MANPTKVKYDASDNESCASDDCRSDDEDYSKEELIDICEQISTSYEKKRKECKELLKKLKALEKSFGELQASHECLKKDHKELDLAHTKLEKAHSSLLERAKEKEAMEEQVITTCDVGLTCDLIDESIVLLLLLLVTLLVALHPPSPTLPPLLVIVSLVMLHYWLRMRISRERWMSSLTP